MTIKISDSVLLQLSEFVASHLGLHFPRERWHDLQRAVGGAAQECGCRHELDRYIQGLLSPVFTQKQLEVLASHLTIGETYFFREKRSLEIFEERILPELIRARAGLGTPIRIWSAGCATGEEPYSVAIVLNKLLAGLKDRNVEILATDLNTNSLQKASAGTYGEWSFRGTPRWVRHTYFEAGEDDRCTIVPAIKKMVRFAQLNLMDDIYPPLSNWTNGFDVIFCRNVLMYFTPEGMKKVIRQLYGSLAKDGWLIVSPTESLPVQVPVHGQPVLPGHVYVAPDGFHMAVGPQGGVQLNTDEPENGLRPAVSYLFRSVAHAYGPRAVGVLLTGMGKDGASELKLMKERGAVTIAQDKDTSIVHGMPGEAIRVGGATYVLPPEKIRMALTSLVSGNGNSKESEITNASNNAPETGNLLLGRDLSGK